MMRKFTKILGWMGIGFAASIVLGALYYCLFALVVNTDVEKTLRRQNRVLRQELPRASGIALMLQGELPYLEDRDAAIYMRVFKAPAPSLGDMGGRYNNLDDAMDAMRRTEAAWRSVFDSIMVRKGRSLPPLVTPIKDLAFTSVGASTGLKMNPFYKVQVNHDGIDLVAPQGTPVYATASGTVTDVQHAQGGKGQMVEIEHARGYVTRYAHLATTDVSPGTFVRTGTRIGTVGDSGRAFTTHLHYEVLKYGQTMDPAHYMLVSQTPLEYYYTLIMSASSGQSLD